MWNLQGSESKRYLDWYDKFGPKFIDGDGKPTSSNASRLFTPATQKLLTLFFNQVDSKALLDAARQHT